MNRPTPVTISRSRLMGLLLLASTGCGGNSAQPPLPQRATELHCQPLKDHVPVQTLEETGCFQDIETITPGPDLIPYGVRSPLWTDGADKQRWVVLPPTETLQLTHNEIQFPRGTTLVKLFSLTGVQDNALNPSHLERLPMEMRFLVKTETQWEAFTYRFSPDGSTAQLLDASADQEITAHGTTLSYHFPNKSSCETCHRNDKPVLGFEIEQLNFEYDYGPSRENQLTALEDIQALVADPPHKTNELPSLVLPTDTKQPLEDRARSWMHANCSHCHRPGGWAALSQMDLRNSVPLADTGTCDVPMEFAGFSSLFRITPGDPEQSGLLVRVNEMFPYRMPPIGVSITDPNGSALLRAWIEDLQTCPSP